MDKIQAEQTNKKLAELRLLIEQGSGKALTLSNDLAFISDKEQKEKMDIVYDKISKCLDLMYEIGSVVPEAAPEEKRKLAAGHRAGKHTCKVDNCPICNGA